MSKLAQSSEPLVAIRTQNLIRAREVLINGVDINYQYVDGRTILHHAIEEKYLPIIDLLLSRKINLNICCKEKRNALHYAVLSKELSIVERLIRTSINDRDIRGCTPLYLASENGNVNIAKKLILAGANINIKDNNELSPAMVAIGNGNSAIVSLLLNSHAEINLFNNKFGNTELHLATYNGKIGIVKKLLGAGAIIDALDMCDETPLYGAINRQRIKIVDLLLKLGAYVGSRNDEEKSELYYAIMAGDYEVIELLLNYNASTTVNRGRNELQDAVSIIGVNVSDNVNMIDRFIEEIKC